MLHSNETREGLLLICAADLIALLRMFFRVICFSWLTTDPNGFDVHELADAKLREFAAITGILHAAKRQSRI